MYAVIFTAEIAELDEEYTRTATHLRQLAIEQYGCRDFVSCTEGTREIAVSYWDTAEQIRAWKQDPQHLAAQRMGRDKWYRTWSVEVVEVRRAYGGP
jgi:heme-degrading monooxygenase HmoA